MVVLLYVREEKKMKYNVTYGPTCAILIHLNCSIVDLTHSLHLNVVSMAVALPFSLDIAIEIFSHILREVVSILELWLKTIINYY